MSKHFSEQFAIEVLYEDDALLVFNKPAPLHSIMHDMNDTVPSLAKLILEFNPDMQTVSLKPEDAGLLQRLDGDTSGCILAAKTRTIWEKLFSDLKAGLIHKTYLALCEGQFTVSQHVDNFIGAKGRHSQKVKIIKKENTARTLRAISDFKPIKTDQKLNLSLVQGYAPTARRHQIRAHLAFLGYPLLGDNLYGAKNSLDMIPNRQFFLHAESLEFKHPITTQELKIKAPLPQCISNLFNIS